MRVLGQKYDLSHDNDIFGVGSKFLKTAVLKNKDSKVRTTLHVTIIESRSEKVYESVILKEEFFYPFSGPTKSFFC